MKYNRLGKLAVLFLTVCIATIMAGSLALAQTEKQATKLALEIPQNLSLGQTVSIQATLTTSDGKPVSGATIEFISPYSFGEYGFDKLNAQEAAAQALGDNATVAALDKMGTTILLGTAVTGDNGVAAIQYNASRAGDGQVVAEFGGDDVYDVSSIANDITVSGDAQVYTPTAGINVPFLGIWIFMVTLGFVWLMYFRVSWMVRGIAAAAQLPVPADSKSRISVDTSKRDFLKHSMVMPAILIVGTGAIGTGLQVIIGRSPKTHNNLKSLAELQAYKYKRTRLSIVGSTDSNSTPLPPILEREVSFSGEILPIFLLRGGPHVVLPQNSAPPHGIKLDTYEHVMANDGFVIPGDVENSGLTDVLFGPTMYMPPIQKAPLSDEQKQLIISWIAQGAKNT